MGDAQCSKQKPEAVGEGDGGMQFYNVWFVTVGKVLRCIVSSVRVDSAQVPRKQSSLLLFNAFVRFYVHGLGVMPKEAFLYSGNGCVCISATVF